MTGSLLQNIKIQHNGVWGTEIIWSWLVLESYPLTSWYQMSHVLQAGWTVSYFSGRKDCFPLKLSHEVRQALGSLNISTMSGLVKIKKGVETLHVQWQQKTGNVPWSLEHLRRIYHVPAKTSRANLSSTRVPDLMPTELAFQSSTGSLHSKT